MKRKVLLHGLLVFSLLLCNSIVYAEEEIAGYYKVTDGIITYVGFLGGGGYTITLSRDNMKITYCHVSPNFLTRSAPEKTPSLSMTKLILTSAY